MLFSLQTPIWQLFCNIFLIIKIHITHRLQLSVFRLPLNVISGQYVYFAGLLKLQTLQTTYRNCTRTAISYFQVNTR